MTIRIVLLGGHESMMSKIITASNICVHKVPVLPETGLASRKAMRAREFSAANMYLDLKGPGCEQPTQMLAAIKGVGRGLRWRGRTDVEGHGEGSQ